MGPGNEGECNMKILGIRDVHGNTARLHGMASALGMADLIIISGDITHFGGRDDAERVFNVVKGYADNVLVVPGNCDHYDVGLFLSEQGVNLDARSLKWEKYTFVGLGGSLSTPGGITPNERTEEELGSLLREAMRDVHPDKSLIMVSHQPPVRTACDIARSIHVGSSAVRSFIEEYEPLVCFSGHIHESTCIDEIGNTKIVNPGPLNNGGYSIVELTETGSAVRIVHGDGRVSQV
jgi:Icc-related predicted phosphoesterase